jgi:hypothetical protein
MTELKSGIYAKILGNAQKRKSHQKLNKPFLTLKSRKLQQIIRIMHTYASGFLRLMERTASGWDALRMGRTVLAPAVGGAAGAGCEELGGDGTCRKGQLCC